MRLPTNIPLSKLPWLLPDGWLGRLFESASQKKTPRLGLVLSCGGARGLAHIGAIQVFEQERIPISTIIGSSMGAYVGALWAAGLDGEKLEELAAEIKDRRTLIKLVDFVCPPTKGFVYGNKVRQHIARTTQERTIAELEKAMLIVATNLDTVSGELLPPTTSVAAAVHASCAIPGICAPVHLNGRRYIDGGAAEPLPVSLLKKHAHVDAIIAVNVMPTLADVGSCRLMSYPTPPPVPLSVWSRFRSSIGRHVNLFAHGNVLDTFKRCLTSAQLRLIAEESARADVVIHPFFCESKWYDYENFHRYIEAGREAAREALPRIRALLNEPAQPHNEHETVSVITPVGCGSA